MYTRMSYFIDLFQAECVYFFLLKSSNWDFFIATADRV